jgi:hypothetical protein
MYKRINQTGFWTGLLAFVATLAYVTIQVLQVAGHIHFPWDEQLIYGTSLCIVIPFLIAMLALHYVTPPEKQFYSHGALNFTVMYAVFVTANYVVQLVTVIPLKIKGVAARVAVLEQTPHSMFWNFDAIGYICMGLATLMAVPVFEKTGIQKWVRICFLANALMTPLISIVYFYPEFSTRLLFLGFPWGITAPLAMLSLAILFRKNAFAVGAISTDDCHSKG